MDDSQFQSTASNVEAESNALDILNPSVTLSVDDQATIPVVNLAN